LLGQNIEKVSQGAIQSDLNLFAPIAGYVANLQAETGAFAEPQKIIMELVDLNQLQLKLSVFEREMTGLKPGLKINFYSPNNTNDIFIGQVVAYSRTIDPETKAIAVIGSIQQSEKAKLISGMYLEAEIFTGEREVMALPDEAILKSGETRLVIVRTSNDANEMKFITKEVQTGSNSNGFTEILNPEGLDNVLIKGGFNLVME
jgi:cobalt-zinc-cadmium efflux system membrane fusion protein